jgi:hypothetical protein
MRARQITIAPGATVGVFSALAASPQGDWDVYLAGATQLVVAEDASGTNTAFQVGATVAPLRLAVHNEDVHVKNTAGGSTLALSIVLIQR